MVLYICQKEEGKKQTLMKKATIFVFYARDQLVLLKDKKQSEQVPKIGAPIKVDLVGAKKSF